MFSACWSSNRVTMISKSQGKVLTRLNLDCPDRRGALVFSCIFDSKLAATKNDNETNIPPVTIFCSGVFKIPNFPWSKNLIELISKKLI